MLAPNPSQHLESETEPLVNPSLRFSLPESCSRIDRKEQLLTDPRIVGNRLVSPSSHWKNFFTPELTLALPQYPEHELLFRFHHRSGIYGLINDTFSGAQFFSVGYRARF